MIVAVASGKGGTGKTMVAVSLVLALAPEQPMLVDCDVEEPNAALFLRPSMEGRREVGRLTPEIDTQRCTGCGRCAEVCQYHALAVVRGKVLVFPELCHGCGSCTRLCPEEAISERLHVMGVIEQGRSGPVSFAHGVMEVGEVMPSPVIRQLKQWTKEKARPDQLLVLDGPPGTACPVVECLRGADFVLLVTEPTPFGLHDLRLAVQVARDELRRPVGVLINRDGVGDQTVEEYCRAEGIPVLMRIPLDRRIAEAYSAGVPLIEALPEYEIQFQRLYEEIARLTVCVRPTAWEDPR